MAHKIDLSIVKRAIAHYADNCKDGLIVSNTALQEILKSGAKNFFRRSPTSEKIIYDRYKWGEGNCFEFINSRRDDIYCIIDDGIIFLDDGFVFKSELTQGRLSIIELEYFPKLYINVDEDISILVVAEDYENSEGDTPEMALDYSDSNLRHINELQRIIMETAEQRRLVELDSRKVYISEEMSADDGNSVDLASSEDFDSILRASQAAIIAIDRSYVHNFVKVSQFLKTKRENINNVYKIAVDAGDMGLLEEIFRLLKDEKHVYDSVLFHSFHLLTSLVDDDLVTFYEVYESFDKLGIFNSQWEKETASKLSSIDDGIEGINSTLIDILHQSIKMEKNITASINNMSYMTNKSVSALNANVSSRLDKMSSQLSMGSLMAGIQTYESYRWLK